MVIESLSVLFSIFWHINGGKFGLKLPRIVLIKTNIYTDECVLTNACDQHSQDARECLRLGARCSMFNLCAVWHKIDQIWSISCQIQHKRNFESCDAHRKASLFDVRQRLKNVELDRRHLIQLSGRESNLSFHQRQITTLFDNWGFSNCHSDTNWQ